MLGKPQSLMDRFPRTKIEKPLLFLICLACVGVVSVFYVRRDGAAAIEPLRSVQAGQIDKIELYDDSFRNVVAVVADEQAIREFAESCRDAEYYAPGKSTTRTRDLNITVQGDPMLEIHCWYDQNIPDDVIGRIVQNSFPPEGGRLQTVIGSFKSKRLRKWIEANFIRR